MAEDDALRNPPIDPSKKIEPVPEQGDLESKLGTQQPAPFSLEPKAAAGAAKVEAPSPMEMAAQSAQVGQPGGPQAALAAGQPSGPQVAENVQNLIGQINQVKQQLQTSGLTISDSAQQIYQYRLNRLQHNLDVISSRLGIQSQTQMPAPTQAKADESKAKAAGQTPVQTYLSYLTEGQNQLNGAMTALNQIGTGGQPISPGDLMAVQIKVNSAQQEIQFFSALLGQSLDALKQLMNTQM